ncbi:MAG: patatin-like phospholipase family protein [Pseudomonadota bacterium]
MTFRFALPRFATLTLCVGLMASCAFTRPPANACPALPLSMSDLTVKSSQGREGPPVMGGAVNLMLEALQAEARAQRAARSAPRAPITLRVITLSAGGQYGAFGAGFLDGWSDNPATPRPRFDVVTGVSAGAILAPIAFAGPDFDDRLRFFDGISAENVSRRRPLTAIFAAPSVNDPGPLETFLNESLTPELTRAIAARHAEGDQILVSATNLDTTEGEIFDLGAAAGAANAAPCLAEALLASAAIPGLLPPRNINGALYADGGLREQVFFRAVDTARAQVARQSGRPVRVEAYLIVNGALVPPSEPAEDRLTGYFGRAVSTLADEVLRDSIIDAVRFAEMRKDWTLRGMVADVDLSPCGFDSPPTGTFDPCVTALLYGAGERAAERVPIDWLSAADLRAVAEEL